MRAGTAVRLVAGREISTRVRSKAFIWTTVALLVAIIGGSFVLSLLQDHEPDPITVGVSSSAPGLDAALGSAAATTGVEVETRVLDDAAGRQAVRDQDVAAYVETDGAAVTVVVHSTLDPALEPAMAILAQQLALDGAVADLGGDPAAVNQAVLGAAPAVETLGTPTAEVDTAQGLTGVVAGILIFVAIMSSGQMVSQGVVEEKSSRVVELLLSTIRPWQLIAGKVLGIGALGLAQVALYTAAGAGAAAALGLLDGAPVELGSAALWLVVWFVVGYAMYATLLGALSALVSRQEDVGNVITPVIMLLMIPYIIAVSVAPWDPDNTLVTVLSLIPLFSPILMPVRIAMGVAPGWEIALTLGLSVLLVAVLVLVGGRVYERAITRTGARVPLREALRG